MAFLVSGVGIMFGFVPFRTCPLFALMFVSPLSFLLFTSVCRRRFSLFLFSLSLSQVLGKPKPISGLGFPLCLFILATISLFNPHALLHTYIKVTAPRLFFFFSSRRRRLLVWWLALWRLVAFLFGFFFFSVCGGGLLLACKMYNAQFFLGGRETIISPLPVIIMVIIFGSRASHGVPMGIAYQIRGRPPHPLPAERRKERPRKGVGDNIARQPYCHTNSC